MKLKVGDQVLITAGKDQGREGKITKVIPDKQQVVVEGMNVYKRHLKSRGQSQPGQIIERERPLPVANLALKCPKCKQQTRVGYRVSREGDKVRICRKCEGEVDNK